MANRSYANYDDHLGMNERFDTLMPCDAEILETALKEKWPIDKVSQELEVSDENARNLLSAVKDSLQVVDAENPAESFRSAVRQSIEAALKDGLAVTEAIESLVTQICYRSADLGFVIDKKGYHLSQYSRHLKKILKQSIMKAILRSHLKYSLGLIRDTSQFLLTKSRKGVCFWPECFAKAPYCKGARAIQTRKSILITGKSRVVCGELHSC